MRRVFCTCISLLIVGAVCSGLQQRAEEGSASQFFGIWTGTWEGAGSGGFELTLEKGNDGAPTGRVSVTGEPTYKATLKTLAFDSKKMTATYDFPPDEQMEVTLAATFDGDAAKGTWSVRRKGDSADVASGTWKVARSK